MTTNLEVVVSQEATVPMTSPSRGLQTMSPTLNEPIPCPLSARYVGMPFERNVFTGIAAHWRHGMATHCVR